ncbi:hypothetical protein BP1258A_5239 [Burkholderia pseudomallei 1258a]|uniref:Uncharacterized protein n=1 Tax=Burkholderia pseudomallei (strain 1026b) TaxID=884204 RepID=A0A0H3HNS2_BURP2|nr:hypothetical protein BP1026B_I2992 [Burkholderia pseudomallei 1026b]EIF52466.1 hypothetical protein BP1258B_6139 [Burkholderia pseudomallei 1258b]EIF54326.1 hypothetical protein BP1258A_5239 [Burkholderia pseudomallei 1258a]EIF56177.1 hypothetical protein BP1026A_4468 [Burkholderia pseudomallei 1026a]EIF69574.1 hypothetical protein BP354E_5745 [Burkholderia pseudomallei 354e]EIF80094.1 hypothetical protein BP354A_2689 [Burkholderia pseudomallei 354a]
MPEFPFCYRFLKADSYCWSPISGSGAVSVCFTGNSGKGC